MHATARILLVDDDPSLLKMMGVYLGRLGYSVTLANTTEKAWAEVEAAPSGYDIAVLDGSTRAQNAARQPVAVRGGRQRVSHGHHRDRSRRAGTRSRSAKAVRSRDAGGRAAEDACRARRKSLIWPRK